MLYIKAPAKINLTLDVLYKRPDQYHEVEIVIDNDRFSRTAGSLNGSSSAPKPGPVKVGTFVSSLTKAMQDKKTAKLELSLGSSMSATADTWTTPPRVPGWRSG